VLAQRLLLSAARRPGLATVVAAGPTRRVVDRFVAGEALGDALAATSALRAEGIAVTLDHLGEDITEPAQAHANRDAYLALLAALAPLGHGGDVEVSVKLSAFGQRLPDGEALSLAAVRPVVEAASAIGTTVTLDIEDHTTVDRTLAVLDALRADHPEAGVVLASALHRTEADVARLAADGARVRLVKGAYAEPAAVAHQAKPDVDAAYRRCLAVLMAGAGYPMVATHDPALVDLALRLAAEHGRGADGFELQMLYGVRPDEQRRLAAAGHRIRAYVPYGPDWYGYFMRRLAERPANLAFLLRSVATRG
jgi:proline dehydrogenase